MGKCFKMLAVGRCIMEFSVIPATFCNSEIKMKKGKSNSRNHGICTSDQGSADVPYLLVPFCFPHLLTWYLQLLANMLLNPAVKCAHSNVRGTINKTQSGWCMKIHFQLVNESRRVEHTEFLSRHENTAVCIM